MKKLLSLFLAISISLLFVGCSSQQDENTITFIISQRDEFLSSMDAAAKQEAESQGYKLISQDSLSDANKQIQFVTATNAMNAKSIIVNLVDPNIAPDIMEYADGEKVVFINRYPTNDEILGKDAVYVGSDEQLSGKYQGDFLANYFKAQGKTDIKYILLNGITGQTSTINRTESVLQALKDNGITATPASAPLICDYDRAEAMTQITPLLTSGIEFDCIISNNDSMALGAIEALEYNGKNPADIPIVGIDATADGCAAVKAGKLAMTVFQDAKGQGSGAVMAAINLASDLPINTGTTLKLDDENPAIMWVPWEIVTKENVDEFIAR